MANINGRKKWSPVRLLETHELARGGVNGNLNEQAQALADRTELLMEEKASKTEIVQGVFEFGTYAEFDAAKLSLPLNCTVIINEIPTGTQTWGQGTNRWNGTTLTKSAHDPLTLAKAYTDSETKINIQNKLINGNFDNGITGWGYVNATIANVSNNLEVVLTGALANGFTRQTAISTTVGNKYLLKARFKVDNSVCQKVEIGSSSHFGTEGYITVNNPAADEWIEVSEIRTSTIASSMFYLVHTYADAATAANKKLTVDYATLIDLTSSFPDGIPSQEILDKIFTGSEPYSVTAKDLIADYMYPKDSIDVDDVALVLEDDKKPEGFVELFYKNTVMLGFVSATGTIETSSPVSRWTGFLNVSKFNRLVLSGFTQNVNYAFYDEDKKPINVYTLASEGYVLNGSIDVPKRAVYFARSMRLEGFSAPTTSILGVYAKEKLSALATEHNVLGFSNTDREEFVKTEIMTAITKLQGEVTENGVINETEDYQFSGYLDVSDYNGVILSGFSSSALLSRFWFDENKQLVQKFDYNTEPQYYAINGYYAKPKAAKYFAANLKNPSVAETAAAVIHGERQLNTSDFQRKGSSGDAAAGWETTETAMRTQKAIELFNPLYPDVKPLRIVNYGKQPGYDYGSRINFDTEIFRQGWGLQIQMNLTKPNAPHNLYSVKNLQSENGLLAEWGVEGFSWHVCPPGSAWGERAWMMFKLGGHAVRSDTNYSFKNASMAQISAPLWSERTDRGVGKSAGWLESSSDGAIDDTIPTRVMLRQSAHFNSPEYFRVSYSNQAKSGWDHFVRARGSYKAPTAAQHGDSIHKQVFSVATGADEQGNPVTKEVAQIEIVYNDDASPESAKIVFKVWNKVTEAWEEKLVL